MLRKEGYNFAIVTLKDNKLIGNCGLTNVNLIINSYKKCGFKEIGRRRETEKSNGRIL